MRTMQIFLADFKERTRRFSFWAMAAFALFVAVLSVPLPQGTFRVFLVKPEIFKQASNPTWIPMGAAFILGLFLPLVGYVYVKSPIAFDRSTGMMPLLITSRFPRLQYAFGKFFSNFALLLSLLFTVMLGSLFMVFIHFPGQFITPWALVSPFLAIIPGLAFAAALALLSEAIPFFRSHGGSILVTICMFVLIIMGLDEELFQGFLRYIDISGYGWLMTAVNSAAFAASGKPLINGVTVLGGGDWIRDTGTIELTFSGITFSAESILRTVVFLFISISFVCAAALLIERRPIRLKVKRQKKPRKTSLPVFSTSYWQPAPAGRFGFARMAAAEAHRLVTGLRWSWLLPAAGLWLAGWLAPPDIARNVLFPLILGWAVLPFSIMGCEEKQTGMHQWLRTIVKAPQKQALASFFSGFSFAALLALPFLFRSSVSGAIAILAFVGVFPALAQTLGSITKSSRVFQIICIMALYIYLNLPGFFLPTEPAALLRNSLLYFLLIGCLLAALLFEKKSAQR